LANGATDSIIGWLHWIVKEPDGTYTLVADQGVYECSITLAKWMRPLAPG
jgi:hypothetical protein